MKDVVDITLQPLYLWKERRYPLNRRLGGHQNRSGCFGEEEVLRPYRDSNPISLPTLVTLPARLAGNQCTPLDKPTVKNFPPRP